MWRAHALRGCKYNGGGASNAGFGTSDSWFGPFKHSNKGLGIRDAHDSNNLRCGGSGLGQHYRRGLIWGAEK